MCSSDLRNNKFEPLNDTRLAYRVEHNLTNARLLEYECRGENVPDSKFKEALKEINKMCTDVWMPPCANRRKAVTVGSARSSSPTSNLPNSLTSAEEIHASVEYSTRLTRQKIFTLDSAVSLVTSFSDVSDDFSVEELLPNEIFGASADLLADRKSVV